MFVGPEPESLEEDAALLKPVSRTSGGTTLLMAVLLVIIALGAYAYSLQLRDGLGVTGANRPVAWGLYIINFVFFIAISYGGTLTSAILRILRAEWRRPITRLAEVITVCGILIGTLNVVLDLGHPERALTLLVYGRFQSPLLWDLAAITLYLVLSLVYLYLPLIPDLALMRHHAPHLPSWQRRLYDRLSLGWDGSDRQRRRLERIIDAMAVVMIPVAVLVHSVLSWIFGMTVQPMWHSTIFAPYFVMGAIYSGLASLIIAMAIVRRGFGLDRYLGRRQFSNLGLLMLALTFTWMYFTLTEYLTTFYGNEPAEMAVFRAKLSGEFAWLFWTQVFLCAVVPLVVIIPKRLRTIRGLVAASIGVNIGMWLERFLIVVPTLTRPRLSSSIGLYVPTWIEWAVMAGCAAGLVLLVLLFARLFPIVSLWEVREGRFLHSEPGAHGRETAHHRV
jgi:Ni/Fe-hydrogenase subunit HybB-like protein